MRTASSQTNTTPSTQSQKSNQSKKDGQLPDYPRIVDIFGFEFSDDDVPLRTNASAAQPPKPLSNEHPTEKEPVVEVPPRRALRARKPEQQMPYTLDLLRHRDQFRRRGLKPVETHSDHPKVSRKEDDGDQYQADQEDMEIDRDEVYHAPKTNEERAPKRRRIEPSKENRFSQLPKVGINREAIFQDPRKFNIRREGDRTFESSHHEVLHSIVAGLIFRCLITISALERNRLGSLHFIFRNCLLRDIISWNKYHSLLLSLILLPQRSQVCRYQDV